MRYKIYKESSIMSNWIIITVEAMNEIKVNRYSQF
jgi:hypothetical protein